MVAAVLSVNGAATADGPRLSDNLVGNAGFETDNAGWNTQSPSAALASGPGHDSRRSAKLTATAATSNLLLNDSPNVIRDTKAGTEFVGSVWLRTDSDKLPVTFRFREVDGTTLVGRTEVDVVLSGNGWTKVSAEYAASGTGNEVAVQVFAARVPKGSTLYVDDVDVRRVLPEEEKPTESPKPDPTPTDEPKPDPTPTDEPKPDPTPTQGPKGGTLFGASVYTGDGTSFEDALARSNQAYGGLETVRVFHPSLPTGWPGKAGQVEGNVVVSFKASPREVVAGQLDGFFRDWFSKAPRDRDIWWTNYHEPEDNIEGGEFTAEQYREALRRLDQIADSVGNPRLHTITIWMCYDLKPGSGRDWRDYYPGNGVVDLMGWDCYNRGADKGEYYTPASILDDLREVSESMGKPWGMAEYASKLAPGDNGDRRAQWLKDSAAYARQHDATWVHYFDAFGGAVANPEYRLLDNPSKAAWRWVVSGS